MQIMDYLIPWSEFEKNSHRYGDEGIPYYVLEASSNQNFQPRERFVASSLKKAKAQGNKYPYAAIDRLVDGAVTGGWRRTPKTPEWWFSGSHEPDERESNPIRRVRGGYPTQAQRTRGMYMEKAREAKRAYRRETGAFYRPVSEYVREAKRYHRRVTSGFRKSNPVKKRANDLTLEAMEGYTGAPLKYLYSSPSWYAYKIGEYFRATGRPEPNDVRMGRGYSINVRDMTFSFDKKDAITRVK